MQEAPSAQTILKVPSFLGGVTSEAAISILFTLLFIWWLIYSLVVIYHWFRYGRSSWIAVPAIAVHLVVSGAIFVFMTVGLK